MTDNAPLAPSPAAPAQEGRVDAPAGDGYAGYRAAVEASSWSPAEKAEALRWADSEPAAVQAPAAAEPPTAAPAGDGYAEFRQAIEQEVARGSMTREQADAMLRAGGLEVSPAPAADLSPEAEVIDSMFPPAKPEEFTLPKMIDDLGPNTPLPPGFLEFDKQARGWLSEARFTKEIGSAIANEIGQVEGRWQGMNETERALYRQEQRVALDRLWGDEAEAAITLARHLVNELEQKSPGLKKMLDETGAANSAFVIAQIAQHAARLAARRR